MGHLGITEIANLVKEAKEKVEVGSKYYHYKHPDQHYVIVDIAVLEATEEPAVLYKPLYIEEDIVWIRPISSFLSEVELESGEKVSRFTKV